MYVNWDEYKRLKNEEHLTDLKIAKIFQIGKQTLLKAKKKKGIKANETKIQVDWKLYHSYKAQGLTDKVAAKLMNLNPSTLSKKKKERGMI